MIDINNINFHYANRPIFDNISLNIKRGEFVFIVGESGIGKTTLLKLIYMELFPKKGRLKFEDKFSDSVDKDEIAIIRRKMGIIFQDFKLLNDRNVYENIAMPLYIAGEKKETIKKKVFDISSRLGLLDKLNEMPYDISGGEQQRTSIARALINEPVLVIADEPSGNLDPFITLEILKSLNEINMKGTSVIFATHNFEIVKKMRDKRILQIKDRKIFDVKLKV